MENQAIDQAKEPKKDGIDSILSRIHKFDADCSSCRTHMTVLLDVEAKGEKESMYAQCPICGAGIERGTRDKTVWN